MSEYLGTTHVKKARKPHTCWYCGETVQPGQPYSKDVGINDGDFWQVDKCIPCQEFLETPAANEFREQVADEGIGYGDWPLLQDEDYLKFRKAPFLNKNLHPEDNGQN